MLDQLTLVVYGNDETTQIRSLEWLTAAPAICHSWRIHLTGTAVQLAQPSWIPSRHVQEWLEHQGFSTWGQWFSRVTEMAAIRTYCRTHAQLDGQTMPDTWIAEGTVVLLATTQNIVNL